MGTALDVANRFYETTDRHDADGLVDLVAEDMVFVGPLQSTDSGRAYVELNRGLLPHHVATRMKVQFEHGAEVCSIYEMDLTAPDGTTFSADMADWVTVTDGRISAQRIYYDPHRFAQAFGISRSEDA